MNINNDTRQSDKNNLPIGYILCPKVCAKPLTHELTGAQRSDDLSLVIQLQNSFSYAELPSTSEYRKYLNDHVELVFNISIYYTTFFGFEHDFPPYTEIQRMDWRGF